MGISWRYVGLYGGNLQVLHGWYQVAYLLILAYLVIYTARFCLPHYMALHHKQSRISNHLRTFVFDRTFLLLYEDIRTKTLSSWYYILRKTCASEFMSWVFDVREKGLDQQFVSVGCKGFGIWQRSKRSWGRVKARMGNLCGALETGMFWYGLWRLLGGSWGYRYGDF